MVSLRSVPSCVSRLIALALAICAGQTAHAAPVVLTEQGRLTLPNGDPVNSTETVVFALYTADTGGTPVWSEAHDVDFVDGFFTVDLGTVQSLDGIFDGSTYYLGVTVGADAEMMPRGRIGTVAQAATAFDAIGDIHPNQVYVKGQVVIDTEGRWVGPPIPLNIATGAITSSAIADGAITNIDIASAAGIAFSKLATLSSGNILVGDATNKPNPVTMSGDATISNSGQLTIGNSTVSSAKIVDGTIVDGDIGDAAGIAFSKLATLTSGNILVGSATNQANSVAMSGDARISNTGELTIGANAVDSGKIVDNSITNTDISALAGISFSKLASLSAGYMIVGKETNVPAGVAMSGDATLSSSGALTIASDAITSSKILNFTIADADLALNAAISFSKLASLTSGYMIVGNGTNVPQGVRMSGDATLTSSGALTIASGAVTSSKILDQTITNLDISSSSLISGPKIAPIFGTGPTSSAPTISSSMGAADTAVTLSDTTSLPDKGVVRIDSELMSFDGNSSNTLSNLVRGAYGTTAATHTLGAPAYVEVLMAVYSSAAAPVLAVQGSKLVGINTATPAYALDVNGSASLAPNSTDRVGIGTTNSSYKMQVVAANDLAANTAFLAENQYTTSGTGWTEAVIKAGVRGQAGSSNISYATGVYGYSLSTGNNTAGVVGYLNSGTPGNGSGGVIGFFDSTHWGALGYKDTSGTSWGMYSNGDAKVIGKLTVNLNSASGATFALCHVTNGSGTSQEVQDCNTTVSADYAENYPMAADVRAGDIVTLGDVEVTTKDGDRLRQLVKATAPYARGLVGVVSDPSKATDFNVIGYNLREEDRPMPLALNGRVVTMLSTENGFIEPGDPITASTVPGVGMKATTPGMIVGYALDAYHELAPGPVLVFVNPGWWDDDGAATTCNASHDGAITRTERGVELAADVVSVRDDTLASSIVTGPSGTVSVTFAHALGRQKPVVSLTVEGEALAFVQTARFMQDADGNYTGFEIKSFAPSGLAVGGVTVHYLVIAKAPASPLSDVP